MKSGPARLNCRAMTQLEVFLFLGVLVCVAIGLWLICRAVDRFKS